MSFLRVAVVVEVTAEVEKRSAGVPGAFSSLSALATTYGLSMTQRLNRVWLGGRKCVLKLQPPPKTAERRRWDSGRRVTTKCLAWSGAAVGARGVGVRRSDCIDDAAARVRATIESGACRGLAFVNAEGSGEGGALPTYEGKQEVVATDDAAVCDEWLRAHVLGDDDSDALKSRVVVLDFEWSQRDQASELLPDDADNGGEGQVGATGGEGEDEEATAAIAEDGSVDDDATPASASAASTSADDSPVDLIQLATADACIVVSVGRCGFSSLLMRLLRSPAVAKVGKDLRVDWALMRPILRTHDDRPQDCGWTEIADWTPFHVRRCSLSALTRCFLGCDYRLKVRKHRRTDSRRHARARYARARAHMTQSTCTARPRRMHMHTHMRPPCRLSTASRPS